MRARTSGAIAVAVIAAEAMFAAFAMADAPLTLSWTAPPSCPPRAAVVAEVERLLASRGPRSSRVTASATITKARADYHLRMVVQGANGERARALDAPTCEELADAAALILAIAIDPSAADPPPKSSAAPAPAPSIAPPKKVEPNDGGAPAPIVPVPIAPSRPARVAAPIAIAEPRSLRLVAVVGADQGTFVGATPSLRVGAAFVAPPLEIELSGMFTWGGKIAAPMLPSAGGEMLRAGGALAGCFGRSLDAGDKRAPRGSICGGFEGGVIYGTSYGVTSPGSVAAPWLAPTTYAVVRWPVRRSLALRFDLGIAVPIVEASFRIQGLGTVHRVSAVTGSGDVGIELDIFRDGTGIDGALMPLVTLPLAADSGVFSAGSTAPPAQAAGCGVLGSFEDLYEQHFDFVWRNVRRLGVPEASIDDAVQDVFVVVHRRGAEFEGRSSVRTWLYGIVAHVARAHRRKKTLDAAADPDTLADTPNRGPERRAEEAEAMATLYAVLGALDDDKREVLVLVDIEEMSAPEAAEALSLKLNTVYTRLRAARHDFDREVARRAAADGWRLR